ncbi:MAG: nuclear transport factor 2 family protein [Saprospiraceae bacterium]
MSNNLSTIEQMFACFAQGDMPGILAKLDENVSFFNGANPGIVPFAGQYNGKNGAMQYFMALGSNVQTTHIQPSNFREEGNKVIHEVQQDGIVNATGKPFTSKMVFNWEFNDAGLATSWKATGDFSSLEAAFSN